MKIAFVIIHANRHEGTSRAVLEVAERLAVDHQVDLWSRTLEGAANSPLNWIRIQGPQRPEVADFVSFRWLVDRQIGAYDYDVIHAAGMNTDFADVYTVQTVQTEKIERTKSERVKSEVSWPRRQCWKAYDSAVIAAERLAYRAAGPRGVRMFLPVSDGTRGELLKWYPEAECGDGNIRVIPNGADLDVFSPDKRARHRDEVRREHGLSEDDFVLLFSGGDWRRKGLDVALQSLQQIADPKVKLLVVGHDRAGADVRRMCGKLNLDARVVFAGFRGDVDRHYAAADLFLFPTTYEAFSLASIEAAASGLPVLMSDVSGAKELLGSGECGSIIRREPAHIAEIIERYVQSPDMLKQHGMGARQIVEKHFNWDAITQETLSVYEHSLRFRCHQEIVP